MTFKIVAEMRRNFFCIASRTLAIEFFGKNSCASFNVKLYVNLIF